MLALSICVTNLSELYLLTKEKGNDVVKAKSFRLKAGYLVLTFLPSNRGIV